MSLALTDLTPPCRKMSLCKNSRLLCLASCLTMWRLSYLGCLCDKGNRFNVGSIALESRLLL